MSRATPSERPDSVRLEGVTKTYGSRGSSAVRALRGVDLALARGEFVSVEGPSGCGKTTLLNLLGLLDAPSEGRVLWGGAAVTALPESERARLRRTGVGFIFQRFYLIPTLTARENVELPMRARGAGRAERRARALALLGEVGLENRPEAFPHELSGGEEQRVAIARALANDPSLLLADEPTGELDRENAERVLGLLEDAHRRRGAGVVVVTHNPAVAERARRHVRMEDGRVVADSASA
jgi:putative ABC transport system ATP-binding protein